MYGYVAGVAMLAVLSSAAFAQMVSMSSQQIGTWNGWRGDCMVEPFEGPKCGLQKKLEPAKQQTGPRPNDVDGEAGRVWVTISKEGTFLSFEPRRIGIATAMTAEIKGLPNVAGGYRGIHVRVDGNDIWTLEHDSPQKTIALHGEEANKIIDEMRAGKTLYLRPNVPFDDAWRLGLHAEEFDLAGFREGLAAVMDRFGELDRNFPSRQRAPVKSPKIN